MFRKLLSVIASGVAALGLAAAVAFAAPDAGVAQSAPRTLGVTSPLTSTQEISGTHDSHQSYIAKAIADRFGVTEEEVMAVHDQEKGWGGVFKVFMLSKLTGQTTSQIIALRDQGLGWGQIYHQFNVKSDKKQNLGQTLKPQSNGAPGKPAFAPTPSKPSDDKGSHGRGQTSQQ
ncbi:MAG: hypothetical protein HY259_05275 [Chloroflexi bacterium]|nr:hypothetical protein [Chloroflexota bacterium]